VTSCLVTPLTMLPLVPQVVVQVFSVTVVRRNPSLCHAPLLTHPVTAARISSLHNWMHVLAVVLPGA